MKKFLDPSVAALDLLEVQAFGGGSHRVADTRAYQDRENAVTEIVSVHRSPPVALYKTFCEVRSYCAKR
jgi:hypothetical protein